MPSSEELPRILRESLHELRAEDSERGPREEPSVVSPKSSTERENQFIHDAGEIEELRASLGIEGGVELPIEAEKELDRLTVSLVETEIPSEPDSGDDARRVERFSEATFDDLAKAQIDGASSTGSERQTIHEARIAFESAFPKGDRELPADYLERMLRTLEQLKTQLPEGYLEALQHEIQKAKGSPSRLRKIASVGVDFLPIVGPSKMLVEAARGKTFGGSGLTGWRRTLHGLEGGAFLVLDATGAGLAVSKGAKGSTLGAKAFTRSAAAARKAGLRPAVYRSLYRTGRTIARSPLLSKLVDESFQRILDYRRGRVAQEALAA
jgi:hypothetical protein